MVKKRTLSKKNSIDHLGREHAEIFHQVNRFEKSLTYFHYEGKASVGKNLRQIKVLSAFFRRELFRHFIMEERALFPFLERYVPRLEPALCLFRAEHKDFRNQLKYFGGLFRKLKKKAGERSRAKLMEEIRGKGFYMVYFLRSHLQGEDSIVYCALKRDLRPAERTLLQKDILKLGLESGQTNRRSL